MAKVTTNVSEEIEHQTSIGLETQVQEHIDETVQEEHNDGA